MGCSALNEPAQAHSLLWVGREGRVGGRGVGEEEAKEVAGRGERDLGEEVRVEEGRGGLEGRGKQWEFECPCM